MQVLRGIDKPFYRPTVITIGNFDGCHRGHQAIFDRLRQQAKARDLTSMVVFFDPQPLEYFQQAPPIRLMSRQQKLRFFMTQGIDVAVCLPFNTIIANMPADLFFEEQLCQRLCLKHLMVGRDFRFGQCRQGGLSELQDWGQAADISVEVLEDVFADGERISSSTVRQLIQAGQFDHAAVLLGRPFCLGGRVVHGDKLAHSLGAPTANISLHAWPSLPVRGVFLAKVQIESQTCWQTAVVNVGYRPTVGGKLPLMEVHLLDGSHSLYGKRLNVRFVKKLRSEQAFPSLDALRQQIHQDIDIARHWATTES